MKKNILYCLLVLLVLNKNALAQLQNGSIAPDFTVTDINNKSHHLYAYLDSGYSVILDLSAVWCGPCWTYHNSGALEELWANHGPIGETGVNSNTTNDVIVLWVEGDPNTADSLIYGGGNSAGNWTDGVDFPIINDNNLAPTYALTYWPTIYTICPNRTLTLSGTINATAHYNLIQNCVQATQGLNAGILSYQGDTITCGTSVNAKAIVQNLGTEELTAFTIKVFEGTNELASENYSGNPMSTYATTEIEFGNVAISGSTNLEIKINDIQLSVLNVLGKVVIDKTINLNKGENEVPIKFNGLKNGLYIVSLVSSSFNQSLNIIKIN